MVLAEKILKMLEIVHFQTSNSGFGILVGKKTPQTTMKYKMKNDEKPLDLAGGYFNYQTQLMITTFESLGTCRPINHWCHSHDFWGCICYM